MQKKPAVHWSLLSMEILAKRGRSILLVKTGEIDLKGEKFALARIYNTNYQRWSYEMIADAFIKFGYWTLYEGPQDIVDTFQPFPPGTTRGEI
jgi:hypothetical protein